mgnify:CR=1 FL=1
MKTENEVRGLLNQVSQKIENTRNKCNEKKRFSAEWEMYDREYAKLTAQYNILLEVLK